MGGFRVLHQCGYIKKNSWGWIWEVGRRSVRLHLTQERNCPWLNIGKLCFLGFGEEQDGKRPPPYWCLWHLVQRGSDSWPWVTTRDRHCVSRPCQCGLESRHTRCHQLILCICLPCLAVLNCLVDGLGQEWQIEAYFAQTPNKANTSTHTVSKEPNETLKKIPKQFCCCKYLT